MLFVAIYFAIGLSAVFVDCKPRSISRDKPHAELEWSGKLSDNQTIHIWTVASKGLFGEISKPAWIQVDIRGSNSSQDAIRLIFDQEHRLRYCVFGTDTVETSVSLDDADLLTRNPIYLEHFFFTSANEFLRACKELRRASEEPAKLVRRPRTAYRANPMIMPGTLWCGKGNAATRERTFGDEIETDMCCRTHDRCFENIQSLTSKFGYYNPSPVTISNCECDDEFLSCLENAGTEAATRVGNLYFNVFKIPCFLRRTERICTHNDESGACGQFENREDIELFRPQRFVAPYITV
uniref:Phospholipase A2 isozyme PA4 n=2 Tax=Clonorchis sinensis TaxID=79923 RepID=C6YBD6_CLOSI|nr:phospholipase A2 isozyme PA4 precursor [Clonorchis sinensis]